MQVGMNLLHEGNGPWSSMIMHLIEQDQLAPLTVNYAVGNLTVTWWADITTLNSTYNEVAFNEKTAVMKENLRSKYFHSPITTSLLMKSCL